MACPSFSSIRLGVPERVVEESSRNRWGQRSAIRNESGASRLVVAGRRLVLGRQERRQPRELGRFQSGSEQAQHIERGAGPLLVGVPDQTAQGDVGHPVGRVTPDDLLQVAPAALRVPLFDAQDGDPVRGLGFVFARRIARDDTQTLHGVGNLPRAQDRLGGIPPGLVPVPGALRDPHRLVVTLRSLLEAAGTLRARRVAEGTRVGGTVRRCARRRGHAREKQDHGASHGSDASDRIRLRPLHGVPSVRRVTR